jgi:ectoine hydrolase
MAATPETLPFSLAEYAARAAKAQRAMAEQGIDLLVVSDPSNMAWLTGYDGWSFYTHQCVLLPAAGEPIWWGRAMDAAGAKRTVYMADAGIVGYPDDYVMNPTWKIWRGRLPSAAGRRPPSASRWRTTTIPPPPMRR